MMPLEAEFKDTSVVRGSTCAVHRFLFPLHNLHTGSLCTGWQELVIWNSLQGWAVKSLIGMGYSYGGKARMRRNNREHLPSKAYWAVRFQSLSESIDFLSHIRLCALTSVFDGSASHNRPALVVMTASGSLSTYWSVLMPSIVLYLNWSITEWTSASFTLWSLMETIRLHIERDTAESSQGVTWSWHRDQ